MITLFKTIQELLTGMDIPFYILELNNQKIHYISDHEILNCAYVNKKKGSNGYSVSDIIPMEGVYITIYEAIKEFCCYLSLRENTEAINYTLNFACEFARAGKYKQNYQHSLIPIAYDSDKNNKYAIGIISVLLTKNYNDIILKDRNNNTLYLYDPDNKIFTKQSNRGLTHKEKIILQYTAQGYSNTDISKALSVNINTVKFHKRNISEKLETNNTLEALVKAIGLKII